MTSSDRSNSTQEGFDRAVASLAARQHGAFARAQAIALSASPAVIDGRLTSGRWERAHRGVYRLAGVPPSWRGALMAACLACGPTAVISHLSAAALLGILDRGRRLVEVTIPRSDRRSCPGVVVHRSLALPRADVTTVHAIPVTTPARTLIDLASVETAEALEEALDAALRMRLVSMARLRWRLDEIGGSGRNGAGALRSLLDARAPTSVAAQSPLETRVAQALREAGLPDPVKQYEIRDAGRLIAVVDFAYPDLRVAIEADSYRWHTGRQRFDHDLARRNALTALGWRVIHVTSTDLTTRRDGVLAEIRQAMGASGGARVGSPPRPRDERRADGVPRPAEPTIA